MKLVNLTEYVDVLMRQALYKCDNLHDAQDLVQDTLLAAIVAIKGEKEIKNVNAWLTSVLNHKYYDNLRRKYQQNVIHYEMIDVIPVHINETLMMEDIEEAEEIRKQVGMLSGIYREVMVRHYMKGQKIRDIAERMNLSENTVKSRLDIGRKRIRKEMVMENYSKHSYEPEVLWICSTGIMGSKNEPFSLVGNDKIAMNILILAYKKPLTVTEISKGIGIPAAYLEPIIEKLVDGEIMKRVKDKIYTDFIIYNEMDRVKSLDKQKESADKNYKIVWSMVKEGLTQISLEPFYQRQNQRQRSKLEVYFATRTLQNTIMNVRNEISGINSGYSLETYPVRKNGGKWYAMGNQYPDNYDYNNNPINKYNISGESGNTLERYYNTKFISLYEFDTEIGKTHTIYNSLDILNSGEKVLKMLYGIHSENDKDFDVIGINSLKELNHFAVNGYLTKENGKYAVDLPILSQNEHYRLYEISRIFDQKITKKFREIITSFIKDQGVELPSHLKSVPDWLRYLHSGCYFPMMVITKVKEEGLFLKDIDYPTPGAFMVIEQ